ncbi:MAG: hypothetical protein V4670_04920 [Bacteroidota bacterium]
MATYSMLGMYSLDKINSTQCNIVFNIPDNCYYEIVLATGKYTISIKLNPGQTSPSTTFVEKTELLNLISDDLTLKFEQYTSATTVLKKPNIAGTAL